MGTLGGNVLLDTRCNYYDQNYEWRQAIDFCMKKDGAICWVAPGSPKCLAVQSADSVPVLIALGARAVLASPEGEREVALEELYRNDGIHYLTKRPDELLTEIRVPTPDGWRATYRKLRRRGSFDFPVLSRRRRGPARRGPRRGGAHRARAASPPRRSARRAAEALLPGRPSRRRGDRRGVGRGGRPLAADGQHRLLVPLAQGDDPDWVARAADLVPALRPEPAGRFERFPP